MSAKMLVRVAPEALVVDAPLAYPPDPVVIDPKPKPVEVVTSADVLEHAADLLGEWDWCQGAAQRGDAFCALGAIFFAASGTPPGGAGLDIADETPLYVTARRAFAAATGGKMAGWNDSPGRTKAEVVAKLRQAASHARESA